jgi:hypothetical protein
MSALSKVEMSVSPPFWEFGGCYFDGHGGDEQARADRLDVLARLDGERLTARAAAELMTVTVALPNPRLATKISTVCSIPGRIWIKSCAGASSVKCHTNW